MAKASDIEAKYVQENYKQIMDLICHYEGHLEKLYSIYAQYKENDVLKKVVGSNIEMYTKMVADLSTMLSVVVSRNLGLTE
jgi:hypothetical protein